MRYWLILQPAPGDAPALLPEPTAAVGPDTMIARVPLMKPVFDTPTENLKDGSCASPGKQCV